jgi:putative phosphoesterase
VPTGSRWISPHTPHLNAGSQVSRIALLGDVHANLPALEAVLDHASQQGAFSLWNTGDFVGYGPFPEEVVRRLVEVKALSVIGNYDLKVLKVPKRKDKWNKTKHPQKWLAFKWAYEQLSKESRQYLKTVPKELRFVEGGKHILMTHASQASIEEALTPDTLQERLEELLELSAADGQARADLILFGHSHVPFTRRVEGAWFVNPGSVGRPDDGDPRASYAVLTFEEGSFAAEHFRVAYDVERSVAAIQAHGLPEAFAQMLIQGRDLESILKFEE